MTSRPAANASGTTAYSRQRSRTVGASMCPVDCSRALDEVGHPLPGVDVQLIQRCDVALHSIRPGAAAGECIQGITLELFVAKRFGVDERTPPRDERLRLPAGRIRAQGRRAIAK